MPPSRRLLPVLFTLGLHGLLAGVLLLLPHRGVSTPETVYEIALAGSLVADGGGSSGGPPGQGEGPPPPAVSAAVQAPPEPETPAPVAETMEAAEISPLPEEKFVSSRKVAEPEKKPAKPQKAPPRPQPPKPAPPTEISPKAQPAASGSGTGGNGVGNGNGSGTGTGDGTQNVGGFAAYSANAVDQIPAIARKVMPDYPPKARRLDMQGRVIVRLVVDTSGEPHACTIHEANPPGYFEDAALDAARRTRFIPGKLRGQAVNTVVLLPFTFSLR